MKKINWEESLRNWQPSAGATLVTDVNRLSQIVAFCKYVGEYCFRRIEYFDNPLASKKQVDDDKVSKSEVFEIAAKQIAEHKKVWEVKQALHPDRLTYEFPLAIPDGKKFRYMKFQISEGIKGLNAPSSVKKVYLRYHIANQQIEVKYVEN